jgi:uncharacterized protein YecE (DUF72 family)
LKPGRVHIGISGYEYPSWRGPFYPSKLPKREWFRFASRAFSTIELNGTFYSLKSPAAFARWEAESPSHGFVFAVKGSRYITHNLKLKNAGAALANFYASGVLALGKKAAVFLWQLPATYAFDRARIESFLSALPTSTRDAERIAESHDARLKHGALVRAEQSARYRHAFEVRHPSYFTDAFFDVLASHRIAFVIADTAGKFPYAERVTAPFVYVRLHGSGAIYASRYSDRELDRWADKIAGLTLRGLDVYVYFDNDVEAHAPSDAERLVRRVTKVLGH